MKSAWKIGLALTLAATGVQAADQKAPNPEAPPAPPALTFKAGSWDVYAMGGAVKSTDNGDVVSFGGAGLEYFAWDDISLNLEALGYSFDQTKTQDAVGGGANLMARWYFARWGGLSLFAEGGIGVVQSDHRLIAPNGTHTNFTPQGGLGARLRVTDTISLIAGARYLHISNFDWIHGSTRNPGFDGVGGYGGFVITF